MNKEETKTEKLYKEWCGEDRHLNDCHPVHDSSEVIEFAEYYHAAQSLKGEGEKEITDEQLRDMANERGYKLNNATDGYDD